MPYITTIRNTFSPFGKNIAALASSLGGTITTSGGYRIHTFTTVGSSTFTASGAGTVEYLVVAGGGASGSDGGGGGGAGGYRTGTLSVVGTNYSVSVGAGGTAPANVSSVGTNGGDSIFSTITSTGGGRGGSFWDDADPVYGGAKYTGRPGGSGGGGCAVRGAPSGLTSNADANTGFGGAGNTPSTSPVQGYAGGWGYHAPGQYVYGGGGGGASAAAANQSRLVGQAANGGTGGAGLSNSISGSATFYAGGGGGGTNYYNSGTLGAGGVGGGGNAGASVGNPGTDGLGGGGGSVYHSGGTGAKGGSGIVIIRYPL